MMTRRNNRTHSHSESADGTSSLDVVQLSSLVPQKVHWLWDGRVPLGKLSIWNGDPGVGKSLATLDLAAKVSSGAPLPGTSGGESLRGDVLLLSAEDDAADTILPRLLAAGADCARIKVVGSARCREEGVEYDRPFDLCRDIDRLRGAITPATRLVVIDPLSAFTGNSDTHKDSDVRAVMADLARLAAETGVAVLCVMHLRKGEGAAVYRGMGSLGFVASARAVWAFTKDPNDPSRRLMLNVKNNLAQDDTTTGLSFSIETCHHKGAPVIAWSNEPVLWTADDVLSASSAQRGRPAERRKVAEEWLKAELAGGKKLHAVVEENAKAAGISPSTLNRAKKELGVKSSQSEWQGSWYWELPGGCDDLPAFGQSRHAA